MLQKVFLAIGAVAFVVAAINIANTMIMSIYLCRAPRRDITRKDTDHHRNDKRYKRKPERDHTICRPLLRAAADQGYCMFRLR